jgi:hypothetical protein
MTGSLLRIVPSALEAASKKLLSHADEAVREAAAKVMGAACDLLGLDAQLRMWYARS